MFNRKSLSFSLVHIPIYIYAVYINIKLDRIGHFVIFTILFIVCYACTSVLLPFNCIYVCVKKGYMKGFVIFVVHFSMNVT